MGIYAQLKFDNASVIALSRDGGHSVGDFQGLNVADYVGDQDSAVQANLLEVANYCNVEHLAVMSAQHGVRCVTVTQGGQCPPADILVTTTPGLGLLALAADCVPIALTDQQAGVLVVVHAGWRGLLAGVLEHACIALVQAGGSLADVQAVIGPSICGHCYEVSEELAQQVSDLFPTAFVDSKHVDLGRAVHDWLSAKGIAVQRIAGCTFEDSKLFSFRRANGRPTGRGGLVAVLQHEVNR